jgi:antagonist of KipI
MTLHVLEPGLCTLVVDFGRPHYRSLGVPVGGAADRTALALGNGLVGNTPDAAALELSLAGPTLQARCPLACVVQGAPFELASDRQQLTLGKTFTLQPDEVLRIGGTPRGMRAYVCVRGGIQEPVILGSRSSLQPLRAGSELPCLPDQIQARFIHCAPEKPGQKILRVLEGPQASWFTVEDFFASSEDSTPPQLFRVSPASNRMGMRLQGKPLHVPGRELISEPVCPGSVQVTHDGQCIVLGVDGQTIGGYPKIAQVISADLDTLGQIRPGETVAFRRVSLEEAEAAYRKKWAEVSEWLVRLRTAEVFGSYKTG